MYANYLMPSTSAGVAYPVAVGPAFLPPPPGYHFKPTDVELVKYYLAKKVNNEPIPVSEISSVDIYKHSPQTLGETYPQLGEKVWYFFTPRSRKYQNGLRPNRTTEVAGKWKSTGKDKEVRFHDEVIGFKKVLVYYHQANKTDWIMHEYRLNQPPRTKIDPKDMRLDDWVLCRI
ncbi:nac transcription factor 29 [Phtheirospermum japonicum]|uniref:Nac transcription factor 29 n=1 Tax=Phtheirospermum japonicum TaxID=374723 RepID=A0A830CKM7_9LAMI|nr:nac transcription factor 29 [Phtheirospermum japonicum]